MFNVFGLCRKDEISSDIVAKKAATISKQNSTLSKESKFWRNLDVWFLRYASRRTDKQTYRHADGGITWHPYREWRLLLPISHTAQFYGSKPKVVVNVLNKILSA